MAKNLKPVKKSIYASFITAADNVAQGATVVAEWAKGEASAKKSAEKLTKQTQTGDEIHLSLVKLLNATFVTPFDRTDIYQLSARLDQVMDHLEAAVGTADATGLKSLDSLPAEIGSLSRILSSCATLTADAMTKLKSMKGLEPYWVEITKLEDEADLIHRALLAKLFGGDYDVLTVLKVKAVADELESAVNAFENVAHTVETILVKES